jgi:hypothetical protein
MTITNTNSAEVTLPSLINSRIRWEKTELAKSNAKLYEILGGCFTILQRVLADPRGVDDIENYLTKRKLKFQKSLPIENKLIKLVFGDSDRRRVSAYAIVMRKALEDAANAAADFAQWVRDKGGLEAIRTSTNGGGGAEMDFDLAAEKLNQLPVIATITPSSDQRIPTETGYVMVLARVGADRSVSVVKFMSKVNDARSKAAVTQIIKAREASFASASGADADGKTVDWDELEEETLCDLNSLGENPFNIVAVGAAQPPIDNAA